MSNLNWVVKKYGKLRKGSIFLEKNIYNSWGGVA